MDVALLPKRRGLKLAVGLAAVLAAGWFVYATVNILSPSQGDLDQRVDAVASLAPQDYRLPLAQQLVADGVADTLAISYFDHDTSGIPLDGTGEPVPLALRARACGVLSARRCHRW